MHIDGASPQVVAALEAADRIKGLLARYRLPRGEEIDFQIAIARLLQNAGFVVECERKLAGNLGRIDCYLPEVRVGLELKVKGGGGVTAIHAQLLRYASSDEIDVLMLVSGRAALEAGLPPILGGKPLVVVSVWRGYL